MTELTAQEAVAATADPIHDVGSRLLVGRETFARSAEWGWANPFAFYCAGRGGVLGDVDADVVAAAFGWFNPGLIHQMWEEGIALHGARESAHRMAEALALWGRDHLPDSDAVETFVALAEKLVAGANSSGLPLFAGWRAEPRVDDAPGRAGQLVQVLREWRGANHLVATTAAGLAPIEAILTNEGEGQAKMFGWPEPFPDCSALAGRHEEAQAITDRLCAAVFEAALSPSERGDFAAAVGTIRDAAR